MKCMLVLMTVLISVKAAPYMPMSEMENLMINEQFDQSMMNQIAQQAMERWILQNQYNLMQQQLMAMQQLQKNTPHGTMPMLFNPPPQPVILLMPNTITKTSNRLENPYEIEKPNLKFGIGDADTVVIDAENENIPETDIIPRRAVVILPNGQRFFIGSIISAIPFLPFEVNVPDTIAWMYNGIAGIIGGIGQRLPFRPKPTTEKPVQQIQEPMMPTQESMMPAQKPMIQGSMMQLEAGMPMKESGLKMIQKIMTRKQSVGMPILMLPLAETLPIQMPI